ncbi:MAG: hypothetical protein J0J10_15640 [Bosea sp.]|uniref:hypothetical protein n=1 Tax=Bosea sp. (in: a-proteobacteria) TaxID=1871050 RepID=UPI001AD2A1B5|nr:hypothetical protein [Bosea sp. (in: a-proteobacteria)]MBN9470196.1 hypothetical protein [Bosea sp. (in: a-proteobacteria)]
MTGLALRIGGDTKALDKAMQRAQDIVAHQGKQMVSTMASVGTAMDKSLALKSLKYAAQNSTALTTALRGVAVAAGTIAVGVGLVKLLGAATEAAAEQVERLVKIGESAKSAGVSSTFFQQWTGQARSLKVEAEDLQKALEKLKAVSTVKQGEGGENARNESALEARLRQQVGAGNLSQSNLTSFLGASGNEARLRVMLDLIAQLQAQGKQLAALDLASQFFPPKIVEGIRNGTVEMDKLRKSLSDVKSTDVKIFEDEDIRNAAEMKRRLDEAYRIINNDLKPIYDDFASAGRDFYGSTVSWVEALAGGVRLLGQAYKFLKDSGSEADRIAKNIGNSGFSVALNDKLKSLFPDSYGEGNQTAIAQQLRDAANNKASLASLAAKLGGGAEAEAALAKLAGQMNPTNTAAAQAQSRSMTDGFFADKTKPIITAKPSSGGSADTDRTTSLERYVQSLERARDVAKAEYETVGLGVVAREKAVAMARAQAAAQQDVAAGLRDTATLTDAEVAKINAAAEATGRWKQQADDLRESMDFAKGLMGDALKGFVADLRSGESAADALRNALDRISTKVLDKLIDAGLNAAFGGGGGGFNIFSMLGLGGGYNFNGSGAFSFGAGGYNGAGPFLSMSSGGFTGQGGKNEPAGVVHKGEYVFSKKAVQKLGLGNLNALHRGFATGGPVGMPSVPSGLSRSGGGSITVSPTYSIDARGSQMSEGQFRAILAENNARLKAEMPGYLGKFQQRGGA